MNSAIYRVQTAPLQLRFYLASSAAETTTERKVRSESTETGNKASKECSFTGMETFPFILCKGKMSVAWPKQREFSA